MNHSNLNLPDGLLSALPDAQRLLGDQKALESLLQSPDAQALAALLQQQSGAALQQAASAAERGDTAPLQTLVQSLLNSREGAQAAQRLRNDFSGR